MKKVLLLIALILLNSCVIVGNFSEDREKLHQMGKEDDYCQRKPDRCYLGTPW